MMIRFAPSPYMVTKYLLEVEGLIRGDQHDLKIIQRSEDVIILPRTNNYQISCPQVANTLSFYIDNGRPTSFSAKECWCSLCSIRIIFNCLDIQEENRKIKAAIKTPVEWVGTFMDSSNDNTTILLSRKKWETVQKIVNRVQKEQKEKSNLDHNSLERDRGFLINLSRTYRK